MNTLKMIADILTGSRLLIAAVIGWLGWSHGIQGWPLVTLLLIYSWSSDVLDGVLARMSKNPFPTWIGNHDLLIDMAVAFGLMVFMTASNSSNLSATIIYMLIWILIFSRFGMLSALGKLFQAPIYGWFIFLTFRYDPILGGLMLLFLVFIVFVTWPRFPSDTVPRFLSGFNDNNPSKIT